MFNLATLFVDIKADQAPFDKALSGVRGQLSTANVAVGTFVGNVAASMARAAVSLGGGLFDKTILSASTMGETLDKVSVIFGNSAGIITGAGEEMSAKFGISKNSFDNAAASLGAVFKNSGKSQEEAANLGVSLAKLSEDMASLDNTGSEEAVTALSAAFRGEFDPLERYRVFLSAAKVENEALALGLVKSKREMTDSAKQAATLSLIMKQTGDAQGNLALTSDSTANMMKRFWGTLENLGTGIGQTLMPAFRGLLEGGIGALQGLSGWFNDNRETFSGWVSSVMDGLGVVGLVWRNFGDILEIARLQTVTTIANMLSPIVAFGQNAVTVAEYVGRNWHDLIVDALSATATAFENFVTNMTGLGQAIFEFLSNPAGGFNFEWTPLLTGFQATVEKFPDLIAPEIINVDDQIAAIQDRIASREAGGLAGPAKPGAAGKSELQLLAESAARTAPNEAGAQATADRWKAEIVGAADFAQKLRLAQSSEDVPAKQLTELQQIREQDMKNGELLARIADQSFGAILA